VSEANRLERMVRWFKVMWRKLIAKVTGKTPCSFETKHGHVFEIYKHKRFSGIPVGFCRCQVCGLEATIDPITGLSTQHRAKWRDSVHFGKRLEL